MSKLPKSHRPYTDKYFLRTNEIIKAEGLNPYVRAQVFIRKGPGIVEGIDEAVSILETYSELQKNGGHVYTLGEGAQYSAKETVMVIEGHIQDLVELETMYLGVISAETTKANDEAGPNIEQAQKNMQAVVDAAKGRPVSYFGARHWRFDEDAEIAKAAYKGGATSCSTDNGAAYAQQKGIGTIPHALENIFAWKYGVEHAVAKATEAFDKHIAKEVPRIALIDYANREISDTIATANALEGKLAAVRVDTCGENVAQGGIAEHGKPFWGGTGVTISGVYELRKALDNSGHENVDIILTSGFGNPEKVKAFVDAEKELGVKLFDALGVGGIFKARFATMDIVAVGKDKDSMKPMSKIGRGYQPNEKLVQRW